MVKKSQQQQIFLESWVFYRPLQRYSGTINLIIMSSIITLSLLIFSLLCLSVNAFLSVKLSLRYRIGDLISKKSAMIGVFAFWTVSFLLALLPLFTNTVFTYGLSYANFQYLPIITPIQVRHLFSLLGYYSGSQPGCHLRFARVLQAIAHYSLVQEKG